MKSKIHEHNHGIRNAVSKTPCIHNQEKSDRIGAMIAFGLFFGTLLYVIIESYID